MIVRPWTGRLAGGPERRELRDADAGHHPVVQIEPGPWPILMALAPQSARYSAPSALVTLPAMIVRVGKALRSSFTMSPTPRLAMGRGDAMASMASSTKAPT